MSIDIIEAIVEFHNSAPPFHHSCGRLVKCDACHAWWALWHHADDIIARETVTMQTNLASAYRPEGVP